MHPNRAIDSDTLQAPLRALGSARHRGRYALEVRRLARQQGGPIVPRGAGPRAEGARRGLFEAVRGVGRVPQTSDAPRLEGEGTARRASDFSASGAALGMAAVPDGVTTMRLQR